LCIVVSFSAFPTQTRASRALARHSRWTAGHTRTTTRENDRCHTRRYSQSSSPMQIIEGYRP
jgi:hypothetical protein